MFDFLSLIKYNSPDSYYAYIDHQQMGYVWEDGCVDYHDVRYYQYKPDALLAIRNCLKNHTRPLLIYRDSEFYIYVPSLGYFHKDGNFYSNILNPTGKGYYVDQEEAFYYIDKYVLGLKDEPFFPKYNRKEVQVYTDKNGNTFYVKARGNSRLRWSVGGLVEDTKKETKMFNFEGQIGYVVKDVIKLYYVYIAGLGYLEVDNYSFVLYPTDKQFKNSIYVTQKYYALLALKNMLYRNIEKSCMIDKYYIFIRGLGDFCKSKEFNGDDIYFDNIYEAEKLINEVFDKKLEEEKKLIPDIYFENTDKQEDVKPVGDFQKFDPKKDEMIEGLYLCENNGYFTLARWTKMFGWENRQGNQDLWVQWFSAPPIAYLLEKFKA